MSREMAAEAKLALFPIVIQDGKNIIPSILTILKADNYRYLGRSYPHKHNDYPSDPMPEFHTQGICQRSCER